MTRPTEPSPEQLDRSGESGVLVVATIPTTEVVVQGVPVEWCNAHPGEFDPVTGTRGPTTYTLRDGYMTPAELAEWQDEGGDPDDPAPEPGMLTGQAIADFLGYGDDAGLVALAAQHLIVVTAMARAYTRDRGFDAEGDPFEDVAAVITTATARLVVNPEQNKREQLATGESVTHAGFTGWSLAETIVLNRYRKKAS